MGATRTITIRVNDEPIKLDIDSDQEEVYRRAEAELNALFVKITNSLEKVSSKQALSIVAYELMIKRLKMEDELDVIAKEVDKALPKE